MNPRRYRFLSKAQQAGFERHENANDDWSPNAPAAADFARRDEYAGDRSADAPSVRLSR